MRIARVQVAILALLMLLAPVSPTLRLCLAGEGGGAPVETTDDFVDKWIISGNSIGGALGATAGQWLGTVMAPGPIGWVVGSLIGGFLGGVIGNIIDNQVGGAYNYAAFDRPPIESGGLWIEGAGTWEQAMYQVDMWVINGGNIASLVAHFGVNLFSAFIPGPVGKFMQGYLGILLFDALFGTLGDNLDGMIDGGKIGAEIDRTLGKEDRDPEAEAASRTPRSPFTSVLQDPERTRRRREAYEEYLDLVAADRQDSPEARAAFDRYRRLGE